VCAPKPVGKRLAEKQLDAEARAFHRDTEFEIARELPAGADRAAVFRALAELADHIAEEYAKRPTGWRSTSPKALRAQWQHIEELARQLARELHRVRPLRSEQDPSWFQPTVQALDRLRQEACLHIESHAVRVGARSRGYDPYQHVIIGALLRIWTDIAGGELKYSRGGSTGPLIRFLTITLDVLLSHHAPVPAVRTLAAAIDQEKDRRRHTDRENQKLRAKGRAG
jgi:hypothetical protein